jgi:U6 snRNA phosphodiesterase
LQALSDSLTPTLQAIRQKEFYTNPRFHASFAWALLVKHPYMENPQEENGDVKFTSSESMRSTSPIASLSPEPVLEADFPTISHLPRDLVSTLNDRHSAKLSSLKTGTFDVNEISVKIGKEVSTWRLSG